MERVKVLLVEDGEEYTTTFSRFLGDEMHITRAGNGAEALARLDEGGWDVLFLDMRFDRIPPGELLGDLAATADRFNGDPVRARQFLEDNQGAYILAAARAAGHTLPAVFSHDFDGEPRRWASLERMYGPVSYLPDNMPPGRIREVLRAAAGPRPPGGAPRG